MAVEVETKGQLQEFLDLFARRRWQVLLPAAVVIALGTFVAVVVPKKYVVKTQVELRPVGISISPKEAANAQFQIKSNARVKKVVQELQNREYLALPPDEQQEWIDATVKALKVATVQGAAQGTNFVNIEYADVQKEWAADFLRAIREDWVHDVVERDLRKSEDEAARLLQMRKSLERQLAREEEELTELLRVNDLAPTQTGTDRTSGQDPIFERRRRNEEKLEGIEARILEDEAYLLELRRRLEEMPRRLDREETLVGGIDQQEELQRLDLEIIAVQAQMKGLRTANSQYKILSERIRALEAERAQVAGLVSKGELQRRTEPNPEIEPLRKQIADLETKLTVAKTTRTALLEQIDADQARAADLHEVYREVTERRNKCARLNQEVAAAEADYQKKSREAEQLSSPLANPFAITIEVDPPNKPTEPNPWLIFAFSLVAGLGLGLAVALGLEYSKSCFRTVADIGRVMAVPVLGSVAPIVTREERRAAFLKRAFVGVSSAAFVGSVLFVTWAWANDAKYLSQDLRDAIEALRARMR